ncbi:hypothetical protein IQ279_04085 [Streptomyces verrucosisporus]|uniref:hypothetical protein n=1 Tax=Streptomyces verrucosisporus TaxID=1695161 RepID=UPI0019D008AC|nr:hypothetical protein [Streptomyces verrucosisporus]MBN3928830.1 hypothetical protein [Streptomyces verrucosisporus]
MAVSGYGKRHVPGQRPGRKGDFAELRPRAAAVAAYIDRLPEGADISIKALAARLPYGQQAVGTALRQMSAAGHLRRVRERPPGCGQWVTRTYFSRVPRSDTWWADFLTEAESAEPGAVRETAGKAAPKEGTAPAGTAPEPDGAQERSRAYGTLARLGEADPRMGLSAADCEELAPLVAQWFARGAGERQVVEALTAGLPGEGVHSPRAVAAWRLEHKLPPPPPVRSRTLRLVECTVCGAPGRPEALPGGLCRECRGGERRDGSGGARDGAQDDAQAVDVRRKAAAVRAAMARGRRRGSPDEPRASRAGALRGTAPVRWA